MTNPSASTGGAQQYNFPKTSTPFVDENRILTGPWPRLLISLWQKVGGAAATTASSLYLLLSNNVVVVYSAANGAKVGDMAVANLPGGIPVPQVLGLSPFVFKCTQQGTLAIDSGQVELSRNSGLTWYTVSLVGGAIPIQNGDWCRVTWYKTPPSVVYLPNG